DIEESEAENEVLQAEEIEESSLISFRGREDFCGHEDDDLQDEDRAAIRSFLNSNCLSNIMWSGDRVLVRGKSMIDLLFEKELSSEIIDCFMMILHGLYPHVRFLPIYAQ
ncbi:Unknown protein, partial [Striga hermonthica]